MDKILNAVSIDERNKAIAKLCSFYKKEFGSYHWYYDKLNADLSNAEITGLVANNNKCYYKRADVYFRKVNFVYRFFSPYLVEESCVVTKCMAEELIEKCQAVLDAAHQDGVVKKNGVLIDKLMNEEKYTCEERDCFYQNLPNEWINVAEDLLPTQGGFFFGPTDYSPWYLYDVKDCLTQFKSLVRNWKENEVVYVNMSW